MFQRICMLACAIILIAATAVAQPGPTQGPPIAQGPPPTGSGPYSAIIEEAPGLPSHTLCRPENLGPFNHKNSPPFSVIWILSAALTSPSIFSQTIGGQSAASHPDVPSANESR